MIIEDKLVRILLREHSMLRGMIISLSVIIEDTLTLNSVMGFLMEEADVFSDLGVQAGTISGYNFFRQKNNGSKFTFKWYKFKHITVSTLIRIKNFDKDFVITLKNNKL